MTTRSFFIYLILMAGTTYLVRAIPFVAVKKKIENPFIRSFLYYIPYAVLTAMTIPAIFKKVKNKQNAWEFIKWFTEADTQVQYGTQIEGLLGTMGRFDTANLEALSELSWSHSEYDRLKDQQDELVEIPVIPSSYAVTRNIMNAFREVVNELENPRDTLVWYNRDINDEITRKRENLGLDTDEN